MYTKDKRKSINEIKKQIAMLPVGSITKKKINGKDYYYHRWTENKKRIEKYIPLEELEIFRKQISERKELESKLAKLEQIKDLKANEYISNVIEGETLISFSSPVKKYRKRECFFVLHDYIYNNSQEKVLILYGLRRTGKTTMMRQIISEMDMEDLNKTAFIQVTQKDSLKDINHDLKILEANGVKYVFIDEITLLEDFIQGAALFSDVFVSSGMKIVLSGTDSLGFLFAQDEQLYDRSIMVHTTFIPYREFDSVLGIHGIDEYIRYGGTMSLIGVNYNEKSIFSTSKDVEEYLDTAIAHNIQHSLKYYQEESHFRSLKELYDNNELTNAINRIVEDINHRFTLEVLTKDFKSNDLAISANNLRHDRLSPSNILDRINIEEVTKKLKVLLEIKNKNEQTISINDSHAIEIREYLDMLDLTQDIEIRSLPNTSQTGKRTVITQPGIRYAQAVSLIKSILQDEVFDSLSLTERKYVQERILSEIMGRMLEDIVLLETKIANPEKEVFSLQFAIGEFDMVVFDYQKAECEIFEINHSTEISTNQYRHLVDEEKCKQTEHRYGTIKNKTVLYRGANTIIDGIKYQNVEEYLINLNHDEL